MKRIISVILVMAVGIGLFSIVATAASVSFANVNTTNSTANFSFVVSNPDGLDKVRVSFEPVNGSINNVTSSSGNVVSNGNTYTVEINESTDVVAISIACKIADNQDDMKLNYRGLMAFSDGSTVSGLKTSGTAVGKIVTTVKPTTTEHTETTSKPITTNKSDKKDEKTTAVESTSEELTTVEETTEEKSETTEKVEAKTTTEEIVIEPDDTEPEKSASIDYAKMIKLSIPILIILIIAIIVVLISNKRDEKIRKAFYNEDEDDFELNIDETKTELNDVPDEFNR